MQDMNSAATDAGVQADIPEPEDVEETLKIRPLERIKLHPKVPIEPSAYGRGKNYSRPWILQDGREAPDKGSEMRRCYTVPKKSKYGEGNLLLFIFLQELRYFSMGFTS